MSKHNETQDDGVVDAKADATAVAVADTNTQVSTQVTVQGVTLRFPFMRVGQALSQWRAGGRPPVMGSFYLGKDKQTNILVADMGRENGVDAILLDVVSGIMEDKPFTGAANPPKRWVGPTAEADAAKEGVTLTPQPTGQTWPDSGRPIMRANGTRFCYLQILVPIPEESEAVADFQVFPIGDKLYTPARIEFTKQAFRGLSEIIGNIERVEKFRNRANKDYKFSWSGRVVHLYTEEAASKQTGAVYPILKFGLAVKGGKAVELTKEEKNDFVQFLASVTSTVADINAESSELDV